MEERIIVAANGRNITIQPTRRFIQSGQGELQVRWEATGQNSVEIVDISFDEPNPFTNLGPIQGTNDWGGTNDTDTEGIFKYTITLKVNGDKLPPLDPEVENGPPGGPLDGGG